MGDYAYIIEESGNYDPEGVISCGLQFSDINNKNGPQIIGSCETPDHAKDVAITGNYAFVADRDSGLQIIDVSSKSQPQIIGSCETPGYANSVAIGGTMLLLLIIIAAYRLLTSATRANRRSLESVRPKKMQEV